MQPPYLPPPQTPPENQNAVGMQWVIYIVYSELHLTLSHFASWLFQSLGANTNRLRCPNSINQNRTFLHKPAMCCIR